MASLYVHVPFCPTLCPYCDFHVVRRGPGWVEAYLRRLKEEAQALHERFPKPLRTLYLGGGTPSYLRDRELVALFQSLPWALAEGAEHGQAEAGQGQGGDEQPGVGEQQLH